MSRSRKSAPAAAAAASSASSRPPAPTPVQAPAQPVQNEVCAYLERCYKQYVQQAEPFKFQEIYNNLSKYCRDNRIPLQNIRIGDGLTLLHIVLSFGDVDAVRFLVNDAGDIYSRIPRNVTHPSTNNLLHYCALFASNDYPYLAKNNFNYATHPLNQALITCLDIISDRLKPEAERAADHLEFDPKKSITLAQCHKDGGTHAHAAAISGASDMLRYIHCFSTQGAYDVKRIDGATPLSLNKQPHIQKSPSIMRITAREFAEQQAQIQGMTATQHAHPTPALEGEQASKKRRTAGVNSFFATSSQAAESAPNTPASQANAAPLSPIPFPSTPVFDFSSAHDLRDTNAGQLASPMLRPVSPVADLGMMDAGQAASPTPYSKSP